MHRDLDRARTALTDWLATKLPDARDLQISDLSVPALGSSGDQLMFDARWSESGTQRTQGMVVRVEPAPAKRLFPDTNFAGQCRVMEALERHTGLPVPKVFWLETDPSILGGPFYVMEKLPGSAAELHQDWMAPLGAEELERVWWNGVGAMAQIHLADWERLGLGFLDQPHRGTTPIDQHLAYYREFFASSNDGEPHPVLEAAFEWLEVNKPTNEPTHLLWGDARLGNVLFDDDVHLTAVLDWEMCALGNPAEDLAWWLFNEKTAGPLILGSADPYPSREATIRRYEDLLGCPIEALEYYDVFAAVRVAVCVIRLGALAREQGTTYLDVNPGEVAISALLGSEISAARVLDR